MEATVAELMENLNRMEDLTNAHMNELASVRQETLSVKWKLTRSGEKSKELEASYNANMDLLAGKKFDLMLLEHRENTLKDQMLPEKIKAMEAEKDSLELIHNQIWQARRDFCERAKDFSKQGGFLAKICNNNSDGEEEIQHELVQPELFLPKVNDKELELLEAENASLLTELAKINGDVSTLSENLKTANDEFEMLTKEPNVGTDFIRLQEARTYSENQVDIMESRCKKVQDEIISIEKQLQTFTSERKAAEVLYSDYTSAARNKYSFTNPNTTQSVTAKNYGKIIPIGLKNNVSLESNPKRCESHEELQQNKRKVPSKVTFAVATNNEYDFDQENSRDEKLMMRAESRLEEMKAARDAFVNMKGDTSKMMKTGVTADWIQARPALPKASITEDLALRPSKIPKQKVFVPKNPSALAHKYGPAFANKTLPGFEIKESTGISHNKPSASAPAMKAGQTTSMNLALGERLHMQSEPTAEHGRLAVEKSADSKLPPTSILKPSRKPYIS